MRIRVLLAGLLLFASTASAFAAGPYVGVAGGVSIIHDSDDTAPGYYDATIAYDTGYGFNLSAGYNFDGFRLEGEYGYKAADIKDISGYSYSGADASFNSFMVNGYYDIKTNSAVTPFIGAGLGLIYGELNDNGYTVDDTVPGYQLIAGVGFDLNKNVTLDVSYRLQGAATDFEKDGEKISYLSSNVYAGIRYKF
ncbi:MAG: outer membrane beta-barrel protein [Desulfuromonadaceae bacterium]|nr:outer membrane beta-barrel protein [Desulfuromonadaceae bacterium]